MKRCPDILTMEVEERFQTMLRSGLAITWNDDTFRKPDGAEGVIKKFRMLAIALARMLQRDAQVRTLQITDQEGAGYGPVTGRNDMHSGLESFTRRVKMTVDRFGLVQKRDGLAKLLFMLNRQLRAKCGESLEALIVPADLMFAVGTQPENSRYHNSGRSGGVKEYVVGGIAVYRFGVVKIKNVPIEDCMRVRAFGDFALSAPKLTNNHHYSTRHRGVKMFDMSVNGYVVVPFEDMLRASAFICKNEGMVDDQNGDDAPDHVFTQKVGMPVMQRYDEWGELFDAFNMKGVLEQIIAKRSESDEWAQRFSTALAAATNKREHNFVDAHESKHNVASERTLDIVFAKFNQWWMDEASARLILGTYAGMINILDSNPEPSAQQTLGRILLILRQVGNVMQYDDPDSVKSYLAGGENYRAIINIMQVVNQIARLHGDRVDAVNEQLTMGAKLPLVSIYAGALKSADVFRFDEQEMKFVAESKEEEEEEEEKTLASQIFDAPATNADVLVLLERFDLPIPLCVILARPFRRFACGAVRGIGRSPLGETVGATKHKESNMSVYHYPDKTSFASYTVRTATVAQNPQLVCGADDAFVPTCVGGFDTVLFDLNDQDTVERLKQGDVSGGSIIPMVTTTPPRHIPSIIDVTGFHHEEEKVGELQPHADSLPFYAAYLNQAHIAVSPLSNSYSQFVPANLNTLMLRGDYFEFDPETKKFSDHHIGTSHTGADGMDGDSIVAKMSSE